jgi:hypothetical protein
MLRLRRRKALLALALLLAIAAIAVGLSMIGLPKRVDWAATERVGWIAGILGALLSGLSTAAAFLALRSRHPDAASGRRPGRLIQVGPVPQAAAWSQSRRIQVPLAKAATVGRTAVLTQVLSGMGGVGKTQLAAQLSRHLAARGELDVLVWITASSREAIIAAYAEAAVALGLASAETAPETAATRLLAWLEHARSRWLVVLDNLDAPGDASGWWPPSTKFGRTVVTTRRRDAALHNDARRLIQVDTFTGEEATSYLIRATGATVEQFSDVAALAADLGHLPLALAQAAAFIRDQAIDCAEYRRRLDDHKRPLSNLLPPADALPDAHRSTVAATWALSIDAADRLSPRGVGRPLISLAALLDPNGIPAELFTTEAVIRYVTGDNTRDIDAEMAVEGLRNLHRLSLIIHDPQAGSVRIHALVQRTTRDAFSPAQTAAAAHAAGNALMAIWPDTTHDPALNQMLRANAAALRQHTDDVLVRNGVHPVLIRDGRHLSAVGSIAAAIEYFDRLRVDVADHLDPRHPDRLTIDSELAELRGHAGDRRRAVTELATVLRARHETLGKDHPLTLRTRHDHAHWSGHAGDYESAVSGLEAALADQLRVLGPDHPDVLITRGNLAHWRGESGDFLGAVDAMEELLADRLRVLGPEHPRTLILRLSLAFWRSMAGDRAKGLAEMEHLLADYVRALGPDHPAVLMTRSSMANLRGEAGDHAGAKEAFEAVLKDRLRVLGPEHPHTLTTRVNLAHWLGEVEGAARALAELTAVSADQARVLEPTHLDIMRTEGSLAHWRARSGDVAAAVEMLQSLLERQIRTLSSDHADVRATREVLTHWLDVLCRGPDAVPAKRTTATILGRSRRVSE